MRRLNQWPGCRPFGAAHTPGQSAPCQMCAVVQSVQAARDNLSQGVQVERSSRFAHAIHLKGILMNRLIYIIGAVVVVLAVLAFFGLR